MSTSKRRTRDKEQMRRRILDAAKNLFVKEGFDNVSMRRIAGAIEYSPAALYRYFKGKREILSALRDEGFQRLVEMQKARRAEYPDPMERLKAGGKHYVRFAMEEPDYFHLMFVVECTAEDMEDEWAQSPTESFSMFRRTVEECVDTGYFGDVDLNTLLFSMWSTLHGLAHLMLAGRIQGLHDDFTLDSVLENILEFTLRPGVSNKES